MVSGCTTPDLAMLRWIAYIKSMNLEIRHISGKDIAMTDMLSRVRFENEDDMLNENDYEGEWLLIGRFLRTMTADGSWTREEASQLQKRAYMYFLRNGKIWRYPKKRNDVPLRI